MNRISRKNLPLSMMTVASSLAEMLLVLSLFSKSVFCDTKTAPHKLLQSSLVPRLGDIQIQLIGLAKVIAQLDRDLEHAMTPCDPATSANCQSILPPPELTRMRRAAGFESSYDRVLDELRRKRLLLNQLMGSFRGADDALHTERKRSCSLNLGFHCQTEEISNFADMYDFLSSPMSPGKKRATGMTA